MNWTDGKYHVDRWGPGADFLLGFEKFRLLGRMA